MGSVKGPVKIERILIIFLIGAFLVYGLFEAYKLILGPRIEITTPVNGSTVTAPVILIEGTARNISFITLNDRQIFVDAEGVFREKLLVPEGYTIIKVSAEDRFKKRVTKQVALWRPKTEATKDLIMELKNMTTTTATTSVSE